LPTGTKTWRFKYWPVAISAKSSVNFVVQTDVTRAVQTPWCRAAAS
jgi:hypothetical protein